METSRLFSSIWILSSSLLFLTDVSAAGYISDHIFKEHHSIGRGLLQAQSKCTEDFQTKNYSILTSQCKGPQYLPGPCCKAFKEFACPYADKLNDATTDCATVMFNYINIVGSYPPGLFSNECKDDKIGLRCNVTIGNTNEARVVYDSNVILLLNVLMVSMIACLIFEPVYVNLALYITL